MEQTKISPNQLFTLIVLFEIGTALVVPLGMEAKRDAWLAIFLGLLGGLVLYLLYYRLFVHYPDLPLTSYIQRILGKWVGWPVGLLYVLFFFYGTARDLRDASELLTTASYYHTPLLMMSTLMILIVAYAVFLGLEVLGRAAEIFFMIIILFGFTGNVLIFFSNAVKIENLLPVLENGWKPVLTAAYPQVLMFPFGETVCFTMMFPLLNKRDAVLKSGLAAMGLSGLILIITILVEIATLGVTNVTNSVFPLLKTVDKVTIGHFLERLDALAVLTLIIGDFFKVAVFYYAAYTGLTDLFNVKNQRKYVVLTGTIVLFLSTLIARNITEHLSQGKLSLKYIFTVFSAGIPPLLLIIHHIRQRVEKRKS
ncbi:spore germination protein [Paenibacillus sp. P25]|nr:spore germination protein [Paenibacillus sp. P25]